MLWTRLRCGRCRRDVIEHAGRPTPGDLDLSYPACAATVSMVTTFAVTRPVVPRDGDVRWLTRPEPVATEPGPVAATV